MARDLLEAVRICGKIEMWVDDREHVRERGQNSINPLFAPELAAHARDEAPFVVTITVEPRGVIARNDIEKPGKYSGFAFAVIGPQRVALDAFAIVDKEPNQISEPLFGITLHIKIDSRRRSCKFWCAKHVDCLIANGQCMQRVIAQLGLGVGALAGASGPKGMRELGEREHTLASVSPDRLFADATHDGQVVLLDGLTTTAVAGLANPAMIIQQQLRASL